MARHPHQKRRTLSAAERNSLKFAAETYYVLSPGEVSIAGLCSLDQFDNVSPGTMEKWAHDGHWMARRQQNLENLRQQLRHRISQSLVEDRVKHMEDQQWICDQGMNLLDNDLLQPKGGWEGVATTVVGTMRNMEQMRQTLVTELSVGATPMLPESQTAGMADAIDPEEARAAARALVEIRQRKLRTLPVPESSQRTG